MAFNFNLPGITESYSNLASFPTTGNSRTLYKALDTTNLYTWNGSTYVLVNKEFASSWGELPATAEIPVVTKDEIGLGNVDNTSDANKPVSTATQTALNAKQNTLTLTTTGSSGAATLTGSTINVPNYSIIGLGGVPTSRTITINGSTQDLSSNRTFTVSASITVGTTSITSGTVNRLFFHGTGNVLQQSAALTFDGTKLIVGNSGNAIPNATQILRVVNNTGGADAEFNGNGYARIFFNDYSAATNLKYYEMLNYLTDFKISRLNDANNTRTERLTIFGSSGNINIGTTNPSDAGYKLDINGTARIQGKLSVNTPSAASAVMEITSTTQGFLPPRMTTTQKNAISLPAAGLVIYDTTLNKLCIRGASSWETITSL
jgi:hypothetical protein